MSENFFPLVKGETTSNSPNVSSVMDQLVEGRYYIPEYQRDSAEWSIEKKSLFIESLINNMTIPPLIVYPEDDPTTGRERRQIVDGQQRLTTIRDFIGGRFSLAPESDVEYAQNVGPIIQGKNFGELPDVVKSQIKSYTLNFVVLPKNLELYLRLEIFRRINEGGVPLSPHDLRLATFGDSERVYFLRLAGIFDPERDGAKRMIEAGREKFELEYPWRNPSAWKSWWDQTTHSIGQAPSQMFLYYVISRNIAAVGTILESEKTQQALRLQYDRTTTSVLDLYCAQAQQESKPMTAPIVANLNKLKAWFTDFELWFNAIKSAKIPSVPVNSSTKLAMFIAGAAQTWNSPDELTEKQWENTQLFLTQGPTTIKDKLGKEFMTTRGKWPGQKKQMEQTLAICQSIAAK